MATGNGSAALAKILRQVEKDNISGSIDLANKAIMGLFKVRRESAEGERLDRQWLQWARRARPECKVFENLARAATSKNGPVPWAREKSLPFWLLTVLNNSVFKSIKAAAALIRPGDRILIYSYSSMISHALTMAKDQIPDVLIPKDGHSLRTGQRLQKEGLRVRVVRLDEPFDADKLLIGCDSYDTRGSIINARGTSRIVEFAASRRIPVYCVTTWLKRSTRPLVPPANKAFEKVSIGGRVKLVGDLG